ncbi:unnamed protein product [Brassica oleracea var. botrytis]|uniref:(rape) hypothetical protein n=1 Tax=Brassica napus TaxID=3708 RepID=A0A816Q7F7_BRANA|nr:unnamed protein product [Brassica napus]
MGYRNRYFGFMLYSIQILYICLIRYFHMLIYLYIVSYREINGLRDDGLVEEESFLWSTHGVICEI